MNKKEFGNAADVVKRIKAIGDVVKLQLKKNQNAKTGGGVCPCYWPGNGRWSEICVFSTSRACIHSVNRR